MDQIQLILPIRHTGKNGFLAQYDTSGTLGWALWIGGAGDDVISSIDLGESGAVYICGSFNSSADFSEIGGGLTTTATSFGGLDAFQAKYSSSGILIWLHEDGGSGDDHCSSVDVDTIINQVNFIGQFELDPEIGGFNIGNISNSTIESFILSRDLAGSAQWITETEGTDGDNILTEITSNLDSVYVGGVFNSGSLRFKDYLGNYSTIISNIDNNNEIIIASLSQNTGEFNWQAQIKNNSNDFLGGMIYFNGFLYITGSLSSNAEFPAMGNVSTTSGQNVFISKHHALNGNTDFVTVESPVGNSNAASFDIGFDSTYLAIVGTNDGTIRFDGNSANDLIANGVDGFIAFYTPDSLRFFQRKGVSSSGTVRANAITFNYNNEFYFGGGAQQTIMVDSINLPFSYSNNGYFGRIALASPCNIDFNYNANVYCSSDFNQTPSIMGQSGGVFSSNISGLYFVDTLTGEIAIDSSSGNSYEIYYTLGNCVDTFQLEIIDAGFSYADTLFCNTSADAVPAIQGNYTGSFNSFPLNLDIDSITGIIHFQDTLSGSFLVFHEINNICVDSFEIEIISTAFAYADSLYCVGEPNDSAIIIGNSNGTFSALTSSLLTIDTVSGEIDFTNSNSQNTIVVYTIGSCSSSFPMEIVESDIDYLKPLYCKGESADSAIILGDTNSNAFFYSIPFDPFVDSTNGAINFDSVFAQQYAIVYDIDGCLDTFDLEIESAAFNYTNLDYCKGDLNDSAIVTGALNGIFSSIPPNPHLNPLNGLIDFDSTILGQYAIIYETQNQCTDTFNLELSSAHFNYSNTVYCSYANNDTANILGNSAGTFSSTPSGLITNTITGEIDFANSLDTTYWVYYDVNTCRDSFSVEVIHLVADAGLDTSVCGLSHQLMGQSHPNASYSWTSFEGLDLLPADTLINPQVNVVSDGSYSFQLTLTENQCVAVDTVIIGFFDSVMIDAGPDQFIGQSIANLTAQTNNGSIFYWENLNSIGNIVSPDSLNTNLTDLVSGDYEFTITASNGVCPEKSDNVIYIVDWVFIPSGFSPNGDGLNDVFLVEGARTNVDFEMQIVNRWGELLYATSNIFVGWDGTLNGGLAPTDTYFYFIRIADNSFNGYLELRR